MCCKLYIKTYMPVNVSADTKYDNHLNVVMNAIGTLKISRVFIEFRHRVLVWWLCTPKNMETNVQSKDAQEAESLAELTARHKRESKELASQITALKKSVPKGDRKR